MIKNELKSKTIYVLALISVAVLSFAYQVNTRFVVDLGRKGDAPYLRDFHDSESTDGLSYRWSGETSSILFPGIGAYTPALLRLTLNASRPAGLPLPLVRITANGRELASFAATDQFETYKVALDKQTMGFSGSLEIEVNSESFVPAEVLGGGDLRQLGVLVDSVSVELQPGPIPIVLPSPCHLLCLALTVLLGFLLARQLGMSRALSCVVWALLLGSVLLLVVQGRLWVGQHSLWLFAFMGIANAVTIVARPTKRLVARDDGIPESDMADVYLLLGVVLVLALSHYTRVALVRSIQEDRATDFFINYTAATVLAQGGNIYDADALQAVGELGPKPFTTFDFGSLFATYVTPPLHVILLLPLVPLGYERAGIALLLLNNVLLFSSLALIMMARDREFPHLPEWMLALLLVFGFQPIYISLELGQVDFVILFLIALCYWAYKRGSKLIVGPCLALAAMIKLAPAMLVLYFLWKRELLIFLAAMAALVLAGAVSVLIAGHEAILVFGTRILPALLKGTAFFQNQSLNGFFCRLFVDPSLYYSLQEFPSVPQARILSALTSAVLLVVAAYATRKRARRHRLRFDLEFSLAMVTTLLVSSVAWDHYYTWLLLPFLILLSPELKESLGARPYLPVVALALLAYLTIAVPSTLYEMSLHSADVSMSARTALTLLLSLRLYGALLLYSIFAYLTLRLPPEQSKSVSLQAGRGFQGVSP